MKVFVVIPSYNEAKHIGAVLASLKNYDYQIVVVDDGSSDETRQIAHSHGVTVLSHAINRGQGAALYTGTLYALSQGADVIVHFDSDGQFLAEEINKVITPIIEGKADIVFGSKFLQANQIPWLKKFFIIKPAIWLNNLLTGLKLSDVHNGFRALNRLAAEKIEIKQDAMAHASEIVARTKKCNLRFQEVPVTIIYREFGQGFGGGLKILIDWFIKK
ncbi:MAG: polyprenyl-phospho-N-acetylgalactosaminyl synthase [Patescibacteria group bacterium]|nr:polyprenyl-phospho-N-acetylgalactosaminyl synthase [Patescibacteria group bacterium]